MSEHPRDLGAPVARVLKLWRKRAKGGRMDEHESLVLVAGRGIEGNADRGGRRQVTLLDVTRWREAERQLGELVDPKLRRANVLTEGIDYRQTRGRVLRVGPVVLRIAGETRPCHQMDEAWPGLQRALDPDWRAGAFAEILEGGTIRLGDPLAWGELEASVGEPEPLAPA